MNKIKWYAKDDKRYSEFGAGAGDNAESKEKVYYRADESKE